MSLDAMKQALEALEHIHRTGDTQVFDLCYANTVIPALRAAIEQAQEPVAWMTFNAVGDEDDIWYVNPDGKLLEGWTYKPLYTAPRQWQGLTADEIWDAWCEQAKPERDTKNFVAAFARVVEAKLKEKNT